MFRALQYIKQSIWTSVKYINISVQPSDAAPEVKYLDHDDSAKHAVLSTFEMSDVGPARGPRFCFPIGENWPYKVNYFRGHIRYEAATQPTDNVVLAKCAIESALKKLYDEKLIQNNLVLFHVVTIADDRLQIASTHSIELAYLAEEQAENMNQSAFITSLAYHADLNTIALDFEPMSEQLKAQICASLAQIVINDKLLVDTTCKQALTEIVIGM